MKLQAIIGMFFQNGLTGQAWGDWSGPEATEHISARWLVGEHFRVADHTCCFNTLLISGEHYFSLNSLRGL